MSIANTILSGLKFAAGGDDEHTARVAQAQKNRAQQATLDAHDAQQLTQELYASGVDITSDGRGMSVGALEQLNSDMGRQRMVRLWNSQRAAQKWRDADGNIMSTEIVDFAQGPDGTVIPMVKGHNGKVAPMTEMRSNSDSDKVLQLSEERFEQWSNELYTSNLARAGADFVLGGKLGEIDAARAIALGIAGRNGAKNNAAIEGITEMTGGDPEATSAGLAIIADADEEGTSQILGEMGIDPETVGTDFTAAPIQAESLAAPSGDPTSSPAVEGGLPTAPSAKPETVPQGQLADMVEARGDLVDNLEANKARLEEVNASLAGMPMFDRNMPGGQAAALRREKAQLRKDIKNGEKLANPDGPNIADRMVGAQALAAEQHTSGMPEVLNGIGNELGKMFKAVNPFDLDSYDFTLPKNLSDITSGEYTQREITEPLRAILGTSPTKHNSPQETAAGMMATQGPANPRTTVEDIANDVQPSQDELDSVRGSMQSNNITDVRQLREAQLDEAMEAARVIAMMTEGTKTDKVNMYGGLVNYIQTGNFETTPNDVAQTQLDASREARAVRDLAEAPGKEVLSVTRDAIADARGVFTETLYNTDKKGNRGRQWARPTGAAKAAADNLGIYRLDLVAARDDGRITAAQFRQQERQILRELSRYIAADASTRDTSWFKPGSAMNDFFSTARTTANPLEKMVVSSRDKNGNPKNVRFKKNNGQYVDGEVGIGNITRSYDDGLSAAFIAILEANTKRLGGN